MMIQQRNAYLRSLSVAISLSLLVLVLAAVASDKEAKKKETWIHGVGQSPAVSYYLGVQTLPVSVVISEKQHSGLYIMGVPKCLGHDMGLLKGAILLGIDGYSPATAQDADSWLEHRPTLPMKYSFVALLDGKPTIKSAQVSFLQSRPVPPLSQSVNQESSIDELESYGSSLINNSRKANGKSLLQVDPALSRLARSYAEYMLKHSDKFGLPMKRNPHLDLEGRPPMWRAREQGINIEVHENVGVDTRGQLSDYELVLRQHYIMMTEPVGEHNHRSVLLDDAAHLVGVGIARDRKYSYLVEEFGH